MIKRTRALLLAGVFALGAFPATSRAQAPDAEVQQQLSEAQRHFESLEYEQAIPSAERAITLLQGRQGEAAKHSLATALEIRARSRYGLGDSDAARRDFVDLLKAEPGYTLSGQVSRRVVEVFNDAKSATVSTLRLTLDPADAAVLVDGTRVTTSGDIPVLVGRHTVVASRSGFDSRTEDFAVEAGTPLRRTLTLKRSSAVITIVTSPADVDVVVDGVPRGRTVRGTLPTDVSSRATSAGISAADEVGSLVLANFAAGSHRVELKRACFATVERSQTITQLTDYALDPAKLAPAVATVVTSSRQPDALVFLDGESRGRAPNTAEVCEGPHVVELRASTGRYLQRIEARPGQRVEVNGALRPAFALVSSTQTSLNADLRSAMERALQPLSSILVFAPPADALAAELKADGLPADWLAYDGNRRPLGVSGEVTPSMRRDLSAKIAKAFDAQGIASVTAPVANNRSRLVLTLLGAGIAEPDVIELNLDQPDSVTTSLARLDRSLSFLAPSIGATVVDIVDVAGTVVAAVDANGPAARAGLQPGDIIVSADAQPVTDGVSFAASIAQRMDARPLPLEVRDRSGTRRSLTVSVQMRPRVIGSGDQTLLVNRTLVALRARLSESTDPVEQASIRLNLAAALTHLDAWSDARTELQQITLPDGPGVGPGTVQYMLGLCLANLGNRAEAESAFKLAAASNSLLTEDGPPVRELADVRLAELQRGALR